MSSNLLLSYRNSNVAVRSSDPVDISDYTGMSNMFGTIARRAIPVPTNADFIPLDGNGTIFDLRGTDVSATWLTLSTRSMQFWAYNFCSPLAAVIDRLAESETNGRIEFIDEDGATLKNVSKIPALNRVRKLLLKPNPLQTWHEFNNEQGVLSRIFGYCPVLCITPSGMDKSYTYAMFNLNPFFCDSDVNTDFDPYDLSSKPILKWTINIFGKRIADIPSEDILLIKDGFINQTNPNSGLPISKVAGLDYFVSNICAAMEADNVLLKKKGPLGVFSHDPKPDISGYLPMDDDDKNDIQKDLRRYGLTLGQLQYVISKLPIKWNPMSFNVRDLMTKETVRQGTDGICDRFGYPAELMSGKNATYENRNSAEKYLYQNNIIPYSLRKMARYCIFFGIEGLILDYDHLPVLQEDIMHAGQAAEALSKSLDIDWKLDMITWNEWRIAKGMDTVPGMDTYYSDWLKTHPEMNPQNNSNNASSQQKDTAKKTA